MSPLTRMQKQRHGDPKAIPIRSEEQTGRRKSENDLICDELRTHPNLDLRFKTEARTGRKSRRTVQRICIWIVSIVTGVMVYERWGSEARYALRVWDSVYVRLASPLQRFTQMPWKLTCKCVISCPL